MSSSFTLRKIIILGALALMLVPFSACLNSGVGDIGDPCNKSKLCIGMDQPYADPNEQIVCCDATFTCLTYKECYGDVNNETKTGGENQPCKQDNTCNEGLECCFSIPDSPPTCVKSSNCPKIDGDQPLIDGDTTPEDGDKDAIETTEDGDEDTEGTETETEDDADEEEEGGTPTDGDEETEDEIEQEEVIEYDIPEYEEGYEIDKPYTSNFNGKVCTGDSEGFCWILPLPTMMNLNAVAANDDDSIFAVGDSGTIIKADGYTFDGKVHNKNNINGVYGHSDDDMWFVGDNTFVWHYSANGTEIINKVMLGIQLTDNYTLNDVFDDDNLEGSNTIIVGDDGAVFRRFNKIWNPIKFTNNNLNSVWGIPETIYIIVGQAGRSYVSTSLPTFVQRMTGTTNTLNGVWGADANHIYAVGDNSTILFFADNKWWSFGLPASERAETYNFNAVSGYGEDVFIVGDKGSVFELVYGENAEYKDNEDVPWFIANHYWEKREGTSLETFTDVEVVRKDGTSFAYITGEYGALWATAKFWNGFINLRENVPTVDAVTHLKPAVNTALRGNSSVMYAAFANGEIMQYTISTEAWKKLGSTPDKSAVNDIWLLDGTPWFFGKEVYTVQSGGVYSTYDSLNTIVERVWGFSDNSLFAVGGRVIQYDGNGSWKEITEDFVMPGAGVDGDEESEEEAEEDEEMNLIQSEYDWNGVWGEKPEDVWVVGAKGIAAHRVEKLQAEMAQYIIGWYKQSAMEARIFYDIYGKEDNDIWIIGQDAKLWKYSGTEFDEITIANIEAEEQFTRIWGNSSNYIFILSNKGNIYFSCNGTTFQKVSTGIQGEFKEIWGTSETNLFVGSVNGEAGGILNAIDVDFTCTTPEVDGDEDEEAMESDVMESDEEVQTETEVEAEIEVEVETETEIDVDGDVD